MIKHKAIFSTSEKTISKNIAYLGIQQFGNYGAPIVTSIYLIRITSLSEYGLVAFCISFASYFVILTDFGFNFSAVRKIAGCRDDIKAVSSTVTNVFFAKLSLLALGAFIYFFAISFIPIFEENFLLSALFYLTVLGQTFVPNWIFQALEDMSYATLIISMGKITSVICVILFITKPDQIMYFPIIQGVILLTISCLLFLRLKSKYGIYISRPKVLDIISELQVSFPLFLANVSSSIYTITIMFLIGVLSNVSNVALYSACDKIIQALKGLYYPVVYSTFPSLSVKISKGLRKEVFSIFYKFYVLTILVVFLACGLIFMYASDVLFILFGEDYLVGEPVLKALSFVPVIVLIGNVFGVQILLNLHEDRIFRNILLWGAFICIISCLLSWDSFSAYRAAHINLWIEIFIAIFMSIFAFIKYWKADFDRVNNRKVG